MGQNQGEPAPDRAQTSEGEEVPEAGGHWHALEDLGPHYKPELHGTYLRALVEGIEGCNATNIALSGAYGAGKSSILDGLVQRYDAQTVQVSLATVRPPGSASEVTLVTANELQKEIVKQILYVVDPAKTPASRFPRVTRFRWARGLWWALTAGLAGIAVQWLITIVIALGQGPLRLKWMPEAYVPTFLASSLIVFLLLRLTNGRWAISDLTAGPAKLTLSDKKGSYFDDYLDEIVYFFQASRKRIVILEDMDRFSNVEVFEDLRALNVLLNHAAQLKFPKLHGMRHLYYQITGHMPGHADFNPRNAQSSFFSGPIVFVYAIRDSLITTKTQSTDDVRHDAFGRTKFFDLIVPVVPFITKQNARGALRKELDLLAAGQSEDVTTAELPSDELVRAIAQYFPDQRQIRNIRNEFSMYRDRLLRPGHHPAELTPDRLLALILYKNHEVADFERIRLGEGQLHRVLDLSRELIATNLERINELLNGPTDHLHEEHARKLGTRVFAQAGALGVPLQKHVASQYSTNYQALTEAELQDLELWRKVAAGEAILFVQQRYLNRGQLEAAFDISLNFAAQTPAPVDVDERRLLEKDRAELEQATWAKLWQSPQFTLAQPIESVGRQHDSGVADVERSFAQIVVDVLGEGLSADLIAGDLLTQNFALLSATFDVEFLSVDAQDFVTRVLEQPGRRALDFVSFASVEQVLVEKGDSILERAGMVNIHVLAYLVAHRPDVVHRVTAQLRSWTQQDRAVLRDYFQRYGADAPVDSQNDMVGYLAKLAPSIVAFIATDSAVPHDLRPALFDTVIGSVRPGGLPDEVASDPAVQQYAAENQQSLSSLTNVGESAKQAAHCLAQLNVRIASIGPVSLAARDVLVPNGMFSMSMSNLRVLTDLGDEALVSLEHIREYHDLYEATLPRIREYLELRDDDGATLITVRAPEALEAILADLVKHVGDSSDGMEILRQVASRSSPEATVDTVDSLEGPAQDALLFEQRARPTTDNLFARMSSAGRITESIAYALHQRPRPTISADASAELVNGIIKASKSYPILLTADTIGEFLEEAAGSVALEADAVLQAEESVALRLISDQLIDVVQLRRVADQTSTWAIREALLASVPAPDVSEVTRLVKADDVSAFISSARISLPVRAMSLSLLDQFLAGTTRAANATAIVEHLVRHQVDTNLAQVLDLARAGANRALLLDLLVRQPARSELPDDVATVLNVLGGDYAALLDRQVSKSPTFASGVATSQFLHYMADLGVIRMRDVGINGRLRVQRLYPYG